MLIHNKSTAIRINEDLRSLADQCLIDYALKRNIHPETFSAYIRRLIIEDYRKLIERLKFKEENLKQIEEQK